MYIKIDTLSITVNSEIFLKFDNFFDDWGGRGGQLKP